VVRNSSFEVTVVVLTVAPLLVMDDLGLDVDLALAWAAVDEVVTVVGPSEGEVPGACWISFPCSVMRAGPSLTSSLRSCGRILERMTAFTGSFEASSA